MIASGAALQQTDIQEAIPASLLEKKVSNRDFTDCFCRLFRLHFDD